jgi:MerR-like DNA binding protein
MNATVTLPRIAMTVKPTAPAVAPHIVAAADPLWLPTVSMARKVDCHPRTLRRWAAKGLIPAPAMTAARSRRWPVREVLAALEAARAISPA